MVIFFPDERSRQYYAWTTEDRKDDNAIILLVGTLLIGFFQDWSKEQKS